MKVLVTAASKHGATYGIAEHIAKTLIDHDLTVELTAPEDVRSVDDYDGVIIASAVYAGHWRKQAARFVERFGPSLRERAVWLVSSGPLGEPDADTPQLPALDELLEATGAADHIWFEGKIEKDDLSFAERAIVKAVKAPYGDFRDWDEVTAWADTVAHTLTGG